MLLLGIDLGSSSVKATVIEGESGKCLASAFHPKDEMKIIARKPGWAEQDPETWWTNLKASIADCNNQLGPKNKEIGAIGISYQMHGLVTLDKDFKLNIEVNHATLAGHTFQHELQVAADAGLLGSIDANKGDYQNGWDTDEFPTNIYEITEAMMVILQAGGFKTGGINFDAKIRRNSTDIEDIFIAHISGMDTFARALLIADKVLKDSDYLKMRKARYASFYKGPGKDFEKGKLTLENLRDIAVKKGEPETISGKQELYEQLIKMYLI